MRYIHSFVFSSLLIGALFAQKQDFYLFGEIVSETEFQQYVSENDFPIERNSVNTQRKILPGYILIKMNLNDDTWHIIKNTPKLSGFLGTKGKPIPICNSEAKRISQQVIDGVEKTRPAVMYDIGEQVKVIDGPFASFNGEIEQIDEDKARLRVAVSIFGRSTPVELEYSQVEKI